MKKLAKKLTISKETLVKLNRDLSSVAGGDPPDDGTGDARDTIVPVVSMYPPC